MSIQVLPNAVVALMAAGEVIHRPSDVLKELIENALDAHADSISIELMQGGIEKIKVTDNGKGIEQKQIKKAIEPHATSKLCEIEDLQKMQTYGFRGEALFSIAHVCNFTLSSRTADSDLGQQICLMNPDRELKTSSKAMPVGTIVQANQLFAPYPVRRRFLKSPRLEFQRSLKPIIALALMHYETEFTLRHNLKSELTLKRASSQKQRLEQVFKMTSGSWKCFEKSFDKGKVTLWYSPKGTKGLEQWWFFNKRLVIDNSFKKLASHYFPVGKLIFDVSIDSESIDPNLHPQKLIVGLSFYEGFVATLQEFLEEHFHNLASGQEHLHQPSHGQTEILPTEQVNNAGEREFSKDLSKQRASSSLTDTFDSPQQFDSCRKANSQLNQFEKHTIIRQKDKSVEPDSIDYLWVDDHRALVRLAKEIKLVNMTDFISHWLKISQDAKPLLIPFPVTNPSFRQILLEHHCQLRGELLTHMSPYIDCVALERLLCGAQEKDNHFIAWGKIVKASFWQQWHEELFLTFIKNHTVSATTLNIEPI